jgi:transcriptional regulator with XRE-family HTH domain
MSKLTIGNSIKARRKTLKVTQAQVAELAGISINTLYKIERGQANPTIEIIDKIADVLGLELVLQVKKLNL